MLPVKKILCPTDFSAHSYEAVRAAAELTGPLSAKLILLHVIPPVPVSTTIQTGNMGYNAPPGTGGFNVTEYIRELEESAANRLKQDAEKVLGDSADYEIKIRQGGHEADEIQTFADENDIDLIVIATHGRTGLGRLVIGSVTEKLIRHTDKPVLTLRSKEKAAS